MLSAKEARKIALTSHENVERILERLDAQIRTAAASGEGRVVCYEPDTYVVYEEHHSCPDTTPLMIRLMDRLKGFGYLIDLIYIGPYAQAGLGSMEDDPKMIKKAIQIRW